MIDNFKKWQDLKVGDVVLYRYDPKDSDVLFIACITEKTEEKVEFYDIHSFSEYLEPEPEVFVNAVNEDHFILERVLMQAPSILSVVKTRFPELFL